MANSKGSSSIRNLLYPGRHTLLPPKSPFPSMSPSYVDHLHNPNIGSKIVQKTREANVHHQRTSSENLLVEEQPSWLDDLLNEPETPIRRGGHRRSSSDSFTYLDSINVSNLDYATQDDNRYKNRLSPSSWGSQDFNLHKDSRHALFSAEMNLAKQKNKPWDCLNDVNNPSGHASVKVNNVLYNPGSVYTPKEADGVASTTGEKQDIVESGSNDTRTSEKKDASNAKPSASDTDTKRAKQQFAQRSRVRKLQYISELERNVQALQAEGSEVSAELEFMNQQNLILNMENKALKQRLESLAQEQVIKYLEQEVLEREIGRLRALYQQQPQASSSHRRTKSRDLDSQLANLSLKHKDASSGCDPMTGPLRI